MDRILGPYIQSNHVVNSLLQKKTQSAIRKQCEVAKANSNSMMGQGAVGGSHTMMAYIQL